MSNQQQKLRRQGLKIMKRSIITILLTLGLCLMSEATTNTVSSSKDYNSIENDTNMSNDKNINTSYNLYNSIVGDNKSTTETFEHYMSSTRPGFININLMNEIFPLKEKILASIGLPEDGNSLIKVNEESETIETTEEKSENLVGDEEAAEIEVIEYNCNIKGYVDLNLNVRKEPDWNSEKLGVIEGRTSIKYSYIENNNEWVVIEYNGDYAYLYSEYVKEGEYKEKETTIKADYKTMKAYNDSRKSYMDYKAITSKSSPQWKLQHNYAYTESNGVRAVDGRYCIALGSYYTHNVGQYVDLVLKNGTVIPCIIADQKDDRDTYNNHSIGNDGGVAEFVVQTSSLSSICRTMGDVSYSYDTWKSNVSEIRIYNKNIFSE